MTTVADGDKAAGGTQADVIAFLSKPGSIEQEKGAVERHDTHGAHVFLAGPHAIKIKRAVCYDYMDFSSIEQRRRALLRELEVNRGNAPGIYIDVVAITREGDGQLTWGGAGETVEWALRMRRFDQAALLSRQVAAGLNRETLKSLADEVYRSHRDAAISTNGDGVSRLAAIIAELSSALASEPQLRSYAQRFDIAAARRLQAMEGLLHRRASAGKVRRCHGDLHLNNIVIWDAQPLLFDAIEFNETLATVDTLYDLAFLLMDLDAHGAMPDANIVLNRYLWRCHDDLDLEGLAALPLFMSLRAGVRAMVELQRSRLRGTDGGAMAAARIDRYLKLALGYLKPLPAALVAVGGFSGTGKSVLAAALAPAIGAAPGAIHIRSDLERKALHGVEEDTKLPASAYSEDETARTYERVRAKALAALDAGHAVILDAVFAQPFERAAVDALARACSVGFVGIWLKADPAILKARVSARIGDASDATANVVETQLMRGSGEIDWHTIDASGSPAETLARARAILSKRLPLRGVPQTDFHS